MEGTISFYNGRRGEISIVGYGKVVTFTRDDLPADMRGRDKLVGAKVEFSIRNQGGTPCVSGIALVWERTYEFDTIPNQIAKGPPIPVLRIRKVSGALQLGQHEFWQLLDYRNIKTRWPTHIRRQAREKVTAFLEAKRGGGKR